MTTKIVIVDSANFPISPAAWAGAELVPLAQMKEKLPALAAQPLLVVGGNEIKFDPVLQAQLENAAQPFHLLQFTSKEEAGAMAKQFSFLQSENRTVGIKALLNTGSTIFTESFFNAFGLGAKIDCCHDLARNHLKPAVAFTAWAALQSILIVGLRSLPNNGDKGTGEKVDMQIGADGQRFVCSVSFPLPAAQLAEFRRHPVLTVLRASAASFELRYHKMGSRVELIAIFFSAEGPQQAVECHSYAPTTALEDATTVKEYTFRPLGSLRDGAAAPAPASGFKKKKLSEKMAEAAPAAAPAPTPVVSGSDKLGSNKPDPTLLAKIEDLQTTVNQKDHQIKQLSKEIEGLKVPGQRDVITNIKDTQVQGLKDNVARLEAELAEALEREIEAQNASAAPAAKAAEQYQKKIKDLETKLKAATDGRNAQLVGLEKQLEDAKKKIKEMSKKVTDLTEALRAA